MSLATPERIRIRSGVARLIANPPILTAVESAPEARALPSAGMTRPQRYYDPVRPPPEPAPVAPSRPLPSSRRVSPVARTPFPACRAPYLGGSERVPLSVASPSHAAFPVSQAGRHPRRHFRGLLGLHSRYGPPDCSTAQGGLRHEASARPVTRPRRSSATRANRQLSGWNLPPLVMRALWAHCEVRASTKRDLRSP